jgi:C4-dicarboxylate-specific signal transduction histidine kinase
VEVLANLMTIAVERKKQEELIVEQSIKIVSSSKLAAMGEVASSLANDFNNPLAVIHNQISYLRMLSNSPTMSVKDVLSSASEIEKSLSRMNTLLKSLRSTTKENDNEDLQKVSVKVLIEDTLSYSESRFRKYNVVLFVDSISPDLVIPGRQVQLSQAILNLLNNSLDAIKTSETRWIRVGAEILNDEIVISVTDSGFGIPGELKKKIMDPFFTTKGLADGAGLGLSITRKIVESHKGKLLLNETSLNTRFDILLPASL